jgi:hypothetical protein
MIFFLVSGNTCSRISGIVGGIAMSRADMESATPECQSLRTTDALPEELPASSGVVVNLFAMMGDQSLRK